jgi:hypothetical protein
LLSEIMRSVAKNLWQWSCMVMEVFFWL